MSKMPLFSLPCPSTDAMENARLVDGARGLLLSIVCDDDGREHPSLVIFSKTRAFRTRAEIYCTPWHVEAYDTVCEVNDSEWVAELSRDAVREWRDAWVMRHFIIYVDSFGCLEVVAESATLEDWVKYSGPAERG